LLIVSSIVIADIKIGMVRYMAGTSTAENTILAIEEMVELHPDLDIVISHDGALMDHHNKSRIIFGRDSLDNIIFAPADTAEVSHEIAQYLEEICSLSATYGIVIIPGTLWEVDSSFRVFCSAPIIDRDGKIQRIRRKTHQEKTDTHIDSTIRMDTIVTRDSSMYRYMITITNESRDLPLLYSSSDGPADFWLCLEENWFLGAGRAADEFEQDTAPSLALVDYYFDYDLYSNLFESWLPCSASAFISELSYYSGALWLQNITDSFLPIEQWYRMDYYEELVRGIVAVCDPLNPTLFTGIAENIKPEKFQMTIAPNPFNSSCKITVNENATMEIYDVNGKLVWEHDVGTRHAVSLHNANRTFTWHPDESISSGIFLIRATTGTQTLTKRIVYLK